MPPRLDNATSERDINSSNQTLNALFPQRQKSWMVGGSGGNTVRPTPRANTSKGAGYPATYAQRTTTTVLPSPAPSDEASPTLSHLALSNGGGQHSQRQAFNTDNRQPGFAQRPSPSVSRPREFVPRVASAQRLPPGPPPISQSAVTHHPSPVVTAAHPSRPSSSHSPLQQQGSTAQSFADVQAQFRASQELRSPSFSLISPVQEHSRGILERPVSNKAPPLIASQQVVQTEQDLRQQLSSPSPVLDDSSLAMTYVQPLLLPSALLPKQNQQRSNHETGSRHSHKRQRIHVPMPALKPRVALINAHVESVGGVKYLNNHLERPRFELLIKACNSEDWFYVALHQLFCVWDSPGRAIIASSEGILEGMPSVPTLSIAFKVLGNLIRDNEGLAPNHLKWFIEFPSPLNDLIRTSEAYRNALTSVGNFLSKLASDWSPLSRLCVQRGYPPLADDLMNRMGLPSAILQGIMFTATRRNMGVGDDRFGEQMEKVFAEDQHGHLELAARYNTDRPPSASEIERRNALLVEKYLAINLQRINYTRRVSGSVTGSPMLASPVQQHQPNLQQPVPQRLLSSSIQPRRQTSSPSLNQNFSNQDAYHQQRGSVAAAPSHNPLLQAVAGRPPSGMGYPSPTIFQGLTMNSPVVQSPVQQQGFPCPTPVLRSNSMHMPPTQNPMGPVGSSSSNQNGSAPVSRPQSAVQPQQYTMNQQQEQQMRQQHQIAAQQRQIAAQEQHQLAVQTQQWQAQAQPRQLPTQSASQSAQQAHLDLQLRYMEQQERLGQQQLAPHMRNQSAQQAYLEQQQEQRYIVEAQRQQQVAQSVISMNRAAQLTTTSDGGNSLQQCVHSRNNSVSSAGLQHRARHSPNVQPPQHSPYSNTQGLTAQHQALQLYNDTPAISRPLVPPLGYVQPPQPINPDMTALHQAHVRSPRLVPEGSAPDLPEDDPSRRFYQSVKNFALRPAKIGTSALCILEFSISDASYALISKNKVVGTGHPPVRGFRRGSLQYRLRCIACKRDTTERTLPDWVVSDTVWPETVFLEINSHQLEVRRKNLHGKDLPIDITSFVTPKLASGVGVNRIKVSTSRLRKGTQDIWYFIAVEIVEFLQHPQIMEMCKLQQRIPLSNTLDAIKKSLAPTPADDDDDFAMVVSDLSIDLADPFTARVFEIPVRGSSCLHRECFDLETFLLTRNSKPKRPNQPSMIDVWKCPLCGKDARPYSLQIDDFLVSVRKELAKQDRLDTKAILISPDGSWRAKPESRDMKRKATGVLSDDDDSSDGEGTARKHQSIARSKNSFLNGGSGRASREVEVIELDDD